MIRAKGKDRLPYGAERWSGQIRFTNLDTGEYVKISEQYTQKDVRVVDNGDGTTTGRNRGRYLKVMRDANGTKLEHEGTGTWLDGSWTTVGPLAIPPTTSSSSGRS